MPRWDRNNPDHGPRATRYPGSFLLAVAEALALLQWQPRRWLRSAVACVDVEGNEQLIGLENLYRRLRREERAGWAALLADLLGVAPRDGLTEPPTDLAEVADRLLVRLSPPFTQQGDESDIWSRRLAGKLIVATLVIDSPHSMSYVTEKLLADSGRSADDWFARALANLRAQTPADCLNAVHEESGLLQSEVGDAYDASRALLLDELLPGHERDGFFVALPGRDHLLVLPVSARGLAFAPWLRAIAAKTHRDLPYPICGELFWVRGGVWHPFPIDVQGPHVRLDPPPEFLDVLERLSSFNSDEEGPPEPPVEDDDDTGLSN